MSKDQSPQHASPPTPLRPALFFDRDGVLNLDHGYIYKKEQFEWIEGAMESIKLLNDNGWLVLVVTNQSGIARGYYDRQAVLDLHHWMQSELLNYAAHVDAFYFCPHHPEGSVIELSHACDCRKPAPGMLLKALDEWPIDRRRSCLIGDKSSDIQAAAGAGINGILFEGGELYSIIHNVIGSN
jgi:D-glycero-D-manno-heptose 1,7-bisphosphate phosphatase